MNRLFHVTFTRNVPKIKRSGLKPRWPQNWIKANGESFVDAPALFVFTHEHDAVRWAGKMDWHYHKATGTGKITMLDLVVGDHPWEQDDNDPLSQAGRQGDWLKSYRAVPAHCVVNQRPVTTAMIQDAVRALHNQGEVR